MEVREPAIYAAPAAGIVLMALSTASDGIIGRGTGVLLSIVFVPYLVWVLMEPGRQSGATTPRRPDRAESEAPDPVPEVVRHRGTGPAIGRALAGAAVVAGGAFALVEGVDRVSERAGLAPGFAGATLAGSLVALPFALLVLFPRRRTDDDDPGGATLTVVTGLVTLVPGIAAVVRPYELDGPAALSLLSVAALYAVAASWMLFRGRGGRALGPIVLAAYTACLLISGSL
jgi:Ca2+/Na+ antiporter